MATKTLKIPKLAAAPPADPLPEVEPEGRIIRVARGETPPHSELDAFQQFAWKTFKHRATSRPSNPVLEENLVRAHMRIRADEFTAQAYAYTMIAAIALVAAGVALFLFMDLALGSLVLGLVLAVLLPVLLTPVIFLMVMGSPGRTAKSRGHAIDKKVPSAMNFMSAMASADVNIDQIFRELARQTRIYGAVAEEAAWITRDTEILGVDILTAIREAAARTPSKRFQDFLQGVVTTATSGGQLKPYFLIKAEQYEREAKLDLQQQTETMGLMAEVFVITVFAFPLFLMIILAIFAIIGSGQVVLTFIWVIVALVIPCIEGLFIFVMKVIAAGG
ncbi:MAG: type II secretion system F family protein [Thermoplasmata archaeon]|nr:type II secretion system F family protein [Thermoplasmata archaeon]